MARHHRWSTSGSAHGPVTGRAGPGPALAPAVRCCLILIAALLLTGCSPAHPSAVAGPADQVWVAREYVGGKQCDPQEQYIPPDTRSLLQGAGIAVAEVRIEHHYVCMACGCPTYAATHYARIHRDSVEAAIRMGFVPVQAPSGG
jgi:hypothetical protein